ncbi:MAG: TIM barrel protein [Armatimonadota bacterium]|nr:TIM barrel protein [Armatimonadota bacterium]
MEHSIYRYADVGLIHFMAYPQTMRGDGPILETLREIAADPFFTAVEVTRMDDPAVRREAAALLEQAGMKVAFGAQPALLSRKLSLCDLDESGRQAAVAQVRECIDQAYELNACGLAVLSGPAPADPARYPEATDRLVDSLLALCDYAAARGSMPLSLETFDRVSYGKGALIGPTPEAVALSRRVRAHFPSFGLMVDLSHLPLLRETARECLEAVSEHLVHVHIGNCVMRDSTHPAYGDEHPRFGIAGGENGVEELRVFLQELLRIGYLSPVQPRILSFEVKPIAAFGESSATVIANSKRFLQKAWALVDA